MPLSSKQVAAIKASTTVNHFTIWNGAIRAGKTFSSLLAFLKWLPDAPAGPIAIIGKTRTTIGRNILDVIEQIDPRAITYYTAKSDHAIIMGRKIELIGANDAQAESKVRGLTLAGAYIDEITLLPEAFFVQLTGRLSVPGARLFGTTNPDSPAHWLKTNYIDRADELKWGVWHFTMDDNPALTPEFVAAKKREFTGLWYRRFIQGEWVSAEGAVYNMWDPAKHVTPWADIPPLREIISVGVDYGTTNATAAVMLAQGRDGIIYAVDEWRVDSTDTTRYTDGELSAGLRAWLANGDHYPDRPGQKPTWQPRYTILDPAAASFRAQLAKDGQRTIPADNTVNAGIALIATGLSQGWIKISDRCQALIKEFPGYSWDPKATAAGEDKVIKTADHSLDALRYAVYTTEAAWRRHLPKTP